jgi:hypothetical protein
MPEGVGRFNAYLATASVDECRELHNRLGALLDEFGPASFLISLITATAGGLIAVEQMGVSEEVTIPWAAHHLARIMREERSGVQEVGHA